MFQSDDNERSSRGALMAVALRFIPLPPTTSHWTADLKKRQGAIWSFVVYHRFAMQRRYYSVTQTLIRLQGDLNNCLSTAGSTGRLAGPGDRNFLTTYSYSGA